MVWGIGVENDQKKVDRMSKIVRQIEAYGLKETEVRINVAVTKVENDSIKYLSWIQRDKLTTGITRQIALV